MVNPQMYSTLERSRAQSAQTQEGSDSDVGSSVISLMPMDADSDTEATSSPFNKVAVTLPKTFSAQSLMVVSGSDAENSLDLADLGLDLLRDNDRFLLGWPLLESLEQLRQEFPLDKALLVRRNDREHHNDDVHQLLLRELHSSRLHNAAGVLSEVSDTAWSAPDASFTHSQQLCTALEQANLLLTTARSTSFVPNVDVVKRCSDVRQSLSQICDLIDKRQSGASVGSTATPGRSVERLRSVMAADLLQRSAALRYRWEELASPPDFGNPTRIEDIAAYVCDLLAATRNVAIVGGAGTGKSAIARAVFERVSRRCEHAVWLTVGEDCTVLPLLRLAFAQLFPRYTFKFDSPIKARECLTQLLVELGSNVLLVLDDVAPSSQHSVEALNFATPLDCQDACAGSRLVMTMRPWPGDLQEWLPVLSPAREVVEVPRLTPEQSQHLFRHQAFGDKAAPLPSFVPAETCSRMVEECAGSPLALHALGASMRHCTSAEDWQQRVAELRELQMPGDPPGIRPLQAAAQALPRQLIECFIDCALFPEHALVPELSLVHLLATQAPVCSPTVLQAARFQLGQLVQRALINVELIGGRPHFVMPSALHRIAQDLGRRHGASRTPGRCIRVSSPSPPNTHPDQRSVDELRACIIAAETPMTAAAPWPRMGLLRYLQICNVDCVERLLESHEMPLLQFLSLQNCTGAPALLEVILPAARFRLAHLEVCFQSELSLPGTIGDCVNLAHLDLSGCGALRSLPPSIDRCAELSYLNISGCAALAQLPPDIGACAKLKSLDASFCRDLASIPESLSRCTALSHLDLHRCTKLTHLPDIGGCSQLESLDLSFCQSLSALPESITQCRRLTHIDVQGCDSLASVPKTITSCERLPVAQLQHLRQRVEDTKARQRDAEAASATIAPFRRDLAGWAAAESLRDLKAQAQEVAADLARAGVKDTVGCDELLRVLGDARLHCAVEAIDQLADFPDILHPALDLRADYDKLCGALGAVHAALSHTRARLAAPSALAKGPGAASGASDAPVPDCAQQAQHLRLCSRSHLHMQLYVALKRAEQARVLPLMLRPPPPAALPTPGGQDLQAPFTTPESAATAEPKVTTQHINTPSYHRDEEFVECVRTALRTSRNVGIVGMAGIGKTAVARAVFEDAKSEFQDNVWIDVGREAADLQGMLQSAFRQLFGETRTFNTVQEGVCCIAQRLHSKQRSVLLVLDDVWHSHHHAAVAALNFATPPDPGLRVPGSRLIVTTRQRSTLTYDPYSADALLLDELEVCEVPPLDWQRAQELLASDDDGMAQGTPEVVLSTGELIEMSGGNPLALLSLSAARRRSPRDSESSPDGLWAMLQNAPDPDANIIRSCERSVEALPPSLQQCFIDMGAFPEGALVPEAHLLHLFATHAPLYTTAAVQSAAAKLAELVQHGLAARSADARGEAVYSMHRVLHRVALRYASTGSQLLGVHEPTSLAQAFDGREDDGLRACIMLRATPVPDRWPQLGRLQYLYLGGDVTSFTDAVEATTGTARDMVLKFLRLAGSSGHVELLEALMPAPLLLHLDLSDCAEFVKLPDDIEKSRQLTWLDLSGCAQLEALPEGLGCCHHLASLDLSGCQALGGLPKCIGQCAMLARLDLHGCSQLPALPDSICRCTGLVSLNLSGCVKLKDMPQMLGVCALLSHLDLGSCQRLARLPATLTECSNLAHLDLSGCKCLGRLPAGIGKCVELTHLSLRGCTSFDTDRNPQALPDSLRRCRKLVSLGLNTDVSKNYLSKWTDAHTMLTRLDLGGWSSLTELPGTVTLCKQLVHLNLSRCRRLRCLPEDIAQRSSLVHLELDECDELKKLPSTIGACTQLTHLSISGGANLLELPSLRNCARLVHLDLGNCSSLKQLPIAARVQLTYVNLSGCINLRELPPPRSYMSTNLVHLGLAKSGDLRTLPIGACPQLTHVSLRGHKRLEQLPQSICRSTKLVHLDLLGCDALMRLPEDIGACRQLTRVFICCAELETLPPSFGRCNKLVHLSLGECFKMTLPHDCIGACRQLTHLTLKQCRRMAHLPRLITKCTRVSFLDLSGCTGLQSLPEDFGACSQITHLDMSACQSLAELPQSIGRLAEAETMIIRGCSGLQGLPHTISDCCKLANLHLGGCRSLIKLPDTIFKCESLKFLELNDCVLLDQLPSSIGGCSQLGRLEVMGCPRLKTLPQEIELCTMMWQLNLGGCRGLQSLPEGIGGCTELKLLILSGCTSLTELPEKLGNCAKLEKVDVSGCEALTHLPSSISESKRIKVNGYEAIARRHESVAGSSRSS